MAALALGACADGGDCARQTGLARDGCLAAAVQTAGSASAALAGAAPIDDPLVRDAALMRWVAAHRKGLARADGQAVCAALSAPERNACTRRLDAPHLSR